MPLVFLPQLGDAPTDTIVGRWLKGIGDVVREDDLLLEVSTEKIGAEVPSPLAGRIVRIIAREGDTIPSGAPVCEIEAHALDAPQPGAIPVAETVAVPRDARHLVSPAVRQLLRKHGLELDAIPGTGPRGRVTRNDVLAFVARPEPPPSAPAGVPGERRVPLSAVRRRIAAHMQRSKTLAPHVFSAVEVDVEAIAAARRRMRAAAGETDARALTYLPFFAYATVAALRAHPALNASIDADVEAITFHERVHLAIAVDAEEGLFAPVVRNADELSLLGLARRMRDLAERTRAKGLEPGELTGATFTLTNPGSFGSYMTAPIINQPNVAILSTEAVERRPVVVGNGIEIRHRAFLCLSWDHRAFDGATAGRFLAAVKHHVENTVWDAAAPEQIRPGR
jgi:pyruvate/2-oxoglutarate dehydrogenase complex dihydrolipoamide acyltransferase (E2) component